MEELTGKRRGRKRKAVAVPDDVAQAESAASDNDGNGQADGIQSQSREVDGREDEGWHSFVSRLTDPLLRKVWHPAPETNLIQREHAAFLPVEIGPKQGQLQDGTIIDV